MVMLLILVLLPVAFLMPSGAGAGDIIGGWEAQPHSRPYMAYLKRWNAGQSYFCGGFLVAENFVLTAAHCKGKFYSKITVILGAHDISRREGEQQEIDVSRQIPHARYNKITQDYDIMLLKLAKKVRLNQWVGTIGLPSANVRVLPGANCSVAGWGNTSRRNETFPARLQEVDMQVVADSACTYQGFETYRMMCVGDPAKGKDSGEGDSGDPLVCGGTAQGIVSWGTNNGSPPTVYTRVAFFHSWIREMMSRPQA